MIEGVNSAIAASQFTKSLPGQGGDALARPEGITQDAAEVASVQGGPRAPFVSPFVHMDVSYNQAVLQIRDSETGDVVRQIPSDNRLAAQQRATLAEESIIAEAAIARESAPADNSSAPVEAEQTATHETPEATEITTAAAAVSESGDSGDTAGDSGSVSILA